MGGVGGLKRLNFNFIDIIKVANAFFSPFYIFEPQEFLNSIIMKKNFLIYLRMPSNQFKGSNGKTVDAQRL